MVQRASSVERAIAPELFLPTCQGADTRNATWMLGRLLELPEITEELPSL